MENKAQVKWKLWGKIKYSKRLHQSGELKTKIELEVKVEKRSRKGCKRQMNSFSFRQSKLRRPNNRDYSNSIGH